MTSENRKLAQLKARVRELEKENESLRADRQIYRDYLVSEYEWFTRLASENMYPCLKHCLKEMTRIFNRAERFYIQWPVKG